jgi:hypothetical protein
MNLTEWAPTIEVLGNLGQFLQALVIPVSFWFIWRQLKQQESVSKASNSLEIVSLISSLIKDVTLNREQRDSMQKIGTKTDVHDGSDSHGHEQFIFEQTMIQFMNIFEVAYLLHRQKQIDSPLFRSLEKQARDILKDEAERDVWETYRDDYTDSFRKYVDHLLPKRTGSPS